MVPNASVGIACFLVGSHRHLAVGLPRLRCHEVPHPPHTAAGKENIVKCIPRHPRAYIVDGRPANCPRSLGVHNNWHGLPAYLNRALSARIHEMIYPSPITGGVSARVDDIELVSDGAVLVGLPEALLRIGGRCRVPRSRRRGSRYRRT
jgi:hypothetical protein